jgi:hypothetical protein
MAVSIRERVWAHHARRGMPRLYQQSAYTAIGKLL